MPKVFTIIRDYKSEATKGILKDVTGKLICETLERPNLSNAKDNPNTSVNESGCVPEGTYRCKRYSSPKYPSTWEVTGVLGRSKILIHSANLVTELKGCIAPCTQVIDMNPKNTDKVVPEKKWFASQSRAAFSKLKEIIGDEDFTLIITSLQSLCKLDGSTT